MNKPLRRIAIFWMQRYESFGIAIALSLLAVASAASCRDSASQDKLHAF